MALVNGPDPSQADIIRIRFTRTLLALACFVIGCAAAAVLYILAGFVGLAVPVALAGITVG